MRDWWGGVGNGWGGQRRGDEPTWRERSGEREKGENKKKEEIIKRGEKTDY